MTNCKKLLAIIVALVMLVSTLVSGLVVSAANPLGTLTVKGTSVDEGKDATVTFNLDLGENSVDALHMFVTIASDVAITDAEIGEVAYVSTEDFPAEDEELLDGTDPRLEISTKELAQGKLLFESGVATVAKVTDVEFTVTFATAELDAGDYDFNVTVDATDYDEADYDVITLESAITVCGAEEPKPDCDHADAAFVVTTKPTKDTIGTKTYTCECGETWTEDIEAVEVTDVTVNYSLALNSSIDVGFTVPNTYTKDPNVVDYYAVVTKNIYSYANVVGTNVQNFVKSDFIYHSGKRDKFIYSGVTAKDMSNNINVLVYFEYKDGSFKYMERNFTLTMYVDDCITAYHLNDVAKESTEGLLATLLMDMLIYGAKAQNLFHYNTANPATTGYETLIEKFASTGSIEYSNKYVTTPLDGATHNLLPNLSVESAITILCEVRLGNTKITDLSILEGYYGKIVIDGDTEHPITVDSSEFWVDGGRTYITYNGFTTRQKDNVATFTLYDSNDNPVSNTMSYSIATYAAQYSTAPETNETRMTSDAMVRYLASADAYFSSLN